MTDWSRLFSCWSPFQRRNTAGRLCCCNVWITSEYDLWFYHALLTEKVTQMEDEIAPCIFIGVYRM